MKKNHMKHPMTKPEFNIFGKFPFNEYLSILQKGKNQKILPEIESEVRDTNKNATIKPIPENKGQDELIYDETNNSLIHGVKRMKLDPLWGKILKELMINNPLRIEVILHRAFDTKKYKINETINEYDRNRFDSTICKMNKKCRDIFCITELIDNFGYKKYGLTVEIKKQKSC